MMQVYMQRHAPYEKFNKAYKVQKRKIHKKGNKIV